MVKRNPFLLGMNLSLIVMGIVFNNTTHILISLVSSIYCYLLYSQDKIHQEKINALYEIIDSNHKLFDGWKDTMAQATDDYHLLLSFLTENSHKYPLIEEEFSMYRRNKTLGPLAKA